MGRYVFKLPDVGEGIAEAEIAAWHVKVGDIVQEDQALADVMTDKATVEIPAPVAGTILAINGTPGEMIAIGSELVVLEVEGEGNSTASPEPQKPQVPAEQPTAKAEEAKLPVPKPQPEKPAATKQSSRVERPSVARTPGEKPVAAPAVRRRAFELGIPLQFVQGSGPGGRIDHSDLDAHIESGGQTAANNSSRNRQKTGIEDVKVIGLRRKIAERMQTAKQRIPHFSYIEEVDVTAVEELRAHLNSTKRADQPKLTLLPFLMGALVKALPEFPEINARFDDEAGVVHRHQAVHIGIATQTDGGLLVPVVRHAEALDIWSSASAVAQVAAAARDNKLDRDSLSGSTITITSLGPLGGLATTPVINHPEVAIVGVNKIAERPVIRNGEIVIRKIMNLSSSFDHRVVDGWTAAEFVQRLRALLENPATIFMDT